MSCAILGLGVALPPYSFTKREAADLIKTFFCQTEEQARLLPVLFRQAGANKRHSVLLKRPPGETNCQSFYPQAAGPEDPGPTTQQRMQVYAEASPILACDACRQALHRSNLSAGQISHLVTVSCTGFTAPGIDIELVKCLNLSPTVQRTHIGFMGCHGALNGLQVARALTGADRRARVLLCAVELCSLHLYYRWDPQSVVPHALFADGAAALVASHAFVGADEAWRVADTGSCLFPDSQSAMTWNIGDHGFLMTLSPRVPDLLGRHLRPWLEPWLDGNGLKLQDIHSWAVHPGGPRVLSAVEESLGLDKDVLATSREVLADCGNMSSPTVLFILERLQKRKALRPCVALSFGPGLVAEGALFR